ncbi:MAG: ubiquinol-cytochrome C chaperone [Hyphomicrobiales bacterium]|nr:ubiquinol-cytochrome C chaperone [Hyphomicrobiales bacterium]
MWPFVRQSRAAPIERLHDKVAALARRPILFTRFGVADTFEGRFELLALHFALILRRLGRLPSPASDAAQELVDLVFRRLDQGVREIGVGDVAVPRRMKVLARAFYGRANAYDKALDSADPARIADVLRRNVFADGQGDAGGLARWAMKIERALGELDLGEILGEDLEAAVSDSQQAVPGEP